MCKFSLNTTKVLVILIGSLAYASVFYHRYCISTMITDLTNPMRVSKDEICLLSTSFYIGYALSQLPSGFLVHMYEPGYLICSGTMISSVGSIIMAFSENFVLLCICRFFIGIGCGPIYVSLCRILANWFSLPNYNLLHSIILATGSLGGLIAQGPLSSLIHKTSWRWGFILPGMFGTLIAMLSAIIIRLSPEEAETEQEETDIQTLTDQTAAITPLQVCWAGLKDLLKRSNFWKIAIWLVLTPVCYFSLTSYWIVPYITSNFHFNPTHASYVAMILSISWSVSAPILASLSELFRTRKHLIAVGVIVAMVTAVVLNFLLMGVAEIVLWALLFIFGASSGAVDALALTMAKELARPGSEAVAVGMANSITAVGCCIVIPSIGGIVRRIDGGTRESYSHNAFAYGMWIFFATMLCASFVAISLADDTFRREEVGGEQLLDLE